LPTGMTLSLNIPLVIDADGWKYIKKCSPSFWVRLARIRRPKIVCSPSYAIFRPRANTAMLLDLGHMTRQEHMQEVWG
jgi:hypothetical protein